MAEADKRGSQEPNETSTLEEFQREREKKWAEAKAESADDLVRLNEILDEIGELDVEGALSFSPNRLVNGQPFWDFWDSTEYVANLSKEDITHILWGSTVSRLGVKREDLEKLVDRALKHELTSRQYPRENNKTE